ncbi:UDP-glucose dehydrogenase family protein [Chloroflexota bacterium]
MNGETVSVIGLGKLGLVTSACLAVRGFNVIGVDINQAVTEAINDGRSPLYEPGLAELMNKVKGKFTATDDYKYAVDNSRIIFIFVGTPSEADGSFSTRYVKEATGEIAPHLKDRDDFPVIVLRSTVLPGVTEGVVKPLLEELSGRRCGTDFGLCHNPEILALGSVIHDFFNPDVVIIGESDPVSGELLSSVYRKACENNPPIIRTTLNNAELAKVSLNVFLTMKMSFANTIAEMCERIPGGDVDVISQILGYETAIGRKFLTGALSYGGPCFPRDTKAFHTLAQQTGCQARLNRAADEVNERQNDRVIGLVKQKFGNLTGRTIAILGLTYKPNTDIVEESAAIKIGTALLREGAILSVYDPAGMADARKHLGQNNIRYADSVNECLRGAELCILTTPWDEFKKLTPENFISNMKQPVLFDCWRVLRQPEFIDQMDYFAIGLNPSE